MQTIKTIQDFTSTVHTALTAAFPECRIESADVTKNNGVRLMGMTIHPKNKKIAPTVYMEPYFAVFRSGQRIKTVIGQIISNCTAALSCPNAGIDADEITDFDKVKDKICYKLISKNMNSRLLSTAPHRDYHDLSIVYYVQFSMTDNGLATATVSDSLVQAWGVDEETLYSLAKTNTPAINRGCVVPITDILSGRPVCPGTDESGAYGHFDFKNTENSGLPVYVATNQYKTYGAAAILYDGLLDSVAEKLGSLYVLPSSVHEIIIIPEAFGNPSELKQMVNDINGTEVPAEEILSGSCYCYDAQSHQLKIAV